MNDTHTSGLLVCVLLMLLGACQSSSKHPPIRTADAVDLARFMGDWYVLGNIPTFIEKQAYNAVESYALNEDGSVATTFSFRKGGYDGPARVYHPKGFVRDSATHPNAIWGMQFIWPFKAEYRVLYVSDDYEQTIIGRSKRDYLWIMARTPQIPGPEFDRLLEMVRAEGYDPALVRRVPQQWE